MMEESFPTESQRNVLAALLVSAAFFYPAYWLAMLVLHSGPSLLKLGWANPRVRLFNVSPFFVGPSPFFFDALLTPLFAVGAGVLGSVLLRRRPVLAGLWIACVAQVAASRPLVALLTSRAALAHAPALVVGAAGLLYGLWLMTTASGSRGALDRFGLLTGGYLLPLSLFLSVSRRWEFAAIEVAAAATMAAVAACIRSPHNSSPYANPSRPPQADEGADPWRPAACGVAASVLLLGATYTTQRTIRAARASAYQQGRAAVMASVSRPDPAAPYPKLFFQKGVNFTAEGPAWYAPQHAVRVLDELRKHGVDSIALVPYGFSSRKDSPAIRFGNAAERSDEIEDISALAHQRGMKVMLKPQVWLPRGYPGDVQFSDSRDRAAWFAQYRSFLEYYAALATRMHADIFCIGVEFVQMTRHEAEWRDLIARVRRLYAGPLVYAAAHGEEFERIGFWDALDYIGLSNYYPLPDDLSTEAVLQKVEAVQRKFQRPVILAEAGFTSLKAPHRAPWDETPRELSPQEQARCYDALFRGFYDKPWLQGIYWWKVGTDGRGGPQDGSHTPWGKPAMEVVARWYKNGKR